MMSRFSDTPIETFVRVEPSRDEQLFSVVIGGLVAGACADALGWVTEFMRSPVSISRQLNVDVLTDYVGWRKKVGGRFNTYIDFIGPGEYSDDTQLALAVARSLRGDGRVDHDYFAKHELVRWLDYARGAGRTITAAAKAMSRRRSRWSANFFTQGTLDYRRSGANGAAMRIAPISLANLRAESPPLDDIFANAITTHGHPRAHIGALAYGAAIWEAVRRREESLNDGPRAFLSAIVDRLRDWRPGAADVEGLSEWIRTWNSANGSYEAAYLETVSELEEMLAIAGDRDHRGVLEKIGCFAPATKGSGIATVAAALHLFCWHGRDVEKAIIEAVNAVPADTDTIGAMVGTLAGAYAGYEEIPERWTARLQDMPYFITVGEALTRISIGDSGTELPLRPRVLERDLALTDILHLLKTGDVARDERVRHDVLGAGWIQALHAQEIRRRGGGEMLYARVALDIGQTCQFKAHLPADRPATGVA